MFVACNNEPASPSQGSIECYLNGIIYDAETSAPLKGAKVSIGTQSDTTDQNGCFVLQGVAPGSYNMSVIKDGYLSYIQEDILVDSGRFYNKALSDEDKALLKDLIKDNDEIDDYYMELLFGGERDIDGRNPDIETIGDSTTYGQAVVAVGLRPFNAVLEGNIEIKFSDGSVYKVPEGTGITAFCLDEPVDDAAAEIPLPHIIASFKTTVKEDGNFGFKNIVPGFYYLFVDPMCVTHNDVSFDIDGMFFKDANIVANGSGRTDQLIINVDQEDPFKVNLKVLSVKAVDRSELPLASGSRDIVPEVGMKAGQAICIEFNKPIDESAYGTMFVFSSDHTQLTGYTQYKIINDDRNGYAYVWHDSIQSAVDLRLFFSVSSFDKDKLDSSFYVDYSYQLNITSTNLYGYDYDKELVDGVLKADQPIEIVFDKEIPENSTVEGILVKYTPNNIQGAEMPVEFEYDGKTLFAYAPLDYRQGDLESYYTLKFKITTDDGIIIYNTENGLTEAALRNLVLITGENDCIKFKTASLIIVSTNVTGEYIPDPYSPFVIKLNQSLEGNTVEAGLFSYELGNDTPYSIVPLTCKIEENYIIVSLAENKALSPSFEYRVVILVESERGHLLYKFDSGKVKIHPEFRYFDSEFHNGLDDFKVVGDKYNWNSTKVGFSWTSLGIDLGIDIGKPMVYQLWKRRADEMAWTFLDYIDELREFDYDYRDKTIMFEEPHALADGDLLYDGSVEFLLISYDEDGLMVQSPVLSVKDTVGPNVTSELPSIEPGTTFAAIHENPVEFTLTTDEPIDSIKKADVVIGGAHPEYFEVSWKMSGEKSAAFKVDAINAPLTGSYAEGDLMLTITLRDTTYNETELVLDFKDSGQL